jgi:hypothetical protein
MDGSRIFAVVVDERLKQIQALAEELGRGTTVKDELVQELARLQGR